MAGAVCTRFQVLTAWLGSAAKRAVPNRALSGRSRVSLAAYLSSDGRGFPNLERGLISLASGRNRGLVRPHWRWHYGRAVSTSLLRLFVGFGIALPLGVILGLSLSRNRWVRTLLGPLVVGFQALPSICWLPLAILWFGLNERAIIFVVVMGSVFSITAATYDGTKLISPLLMRAATNMGVRGWKMFWRVVLPAALPAILSGTRQGWSFAWRSLLAGELLTAGHGLGNLLNQGRDLTDMALVMAVMVVIIMLGLAVDLLVLTNFELIIRRRYGLMNQL